MDSWLFFFGFFTRKKFSMQTDNIILISITKDELIDILRGVVRQELNTKKDKELMSFKETCEFLRVSASWLNKQKSEDKIPYKKLGKRVFFFRKEIINALEDSKYSKLKELII